jgi:SAM-dependent methyltransferase
VPAVGIDISRVYPEIGIERMGANRPHLVIGDVENLPLQDGIGDAILAYESFHHIPDRQRAMAGYDRVLKEGGRVVLAEPGGAHEHAEVSVDVMRKYGILERGMELEDVCGYAAGTRLTRIEQVFLAKVTAADAGALVSRDFLRARNSTEGHLFRLSRGDAASRFASLGSPRRRIWPVAKRYIKAALLRIGLD